MGNEYHAGGQLGSPHEIARALGGHVRQGGSIAFPGPGRKPKDRSCTFTFKPEAPDQFIVADAREEIDGVALKDYVRDRLGLKPFKPRRDRGDNNGHRPPAAPSLKIIRDSGSGKAHRLAAGPRAQEEVGNPTAPVGEGGTKTGRLPRRTKPNRIKLVPFAQIRLDTSRRDLIKGLIPRVGLALLWGRPKSGKSFLALDMAMHVALGWPYRGRAVDRGSVVYCYFEGQRAAGARKEAFQQQHLSDHAEDVPFFLMPVTLELVREHQDLIDAIKTTPDVGTPALIVMDTLNRSYTGSESSDEDMTNYVRAADAVREAFDCAVLIVHHCGLDEKRPRGHTALIGAMDAIISVKKEPAGHFIARVEEMKDGPADAVLMSRLLSVGVGIDQDGEPIDSCVVEPMEISAAPPEKKPPRITPGAQIALDALKAAMTAHGTIPPASNQIPASTPTVSLGLWRRYVYQSDPEGNAEARKKSFQRTRQTLQRHGLVGTWGAENGAEEDAQCWIIR